VERCRSPLGRAIPLTDVIPLEFKNWREKFLSDFSDFGFFRFLAVTVFSGIGYILYIFYIYIGKIGISGIKLRTPVFVRVLKFQ
jgi:hypothetical protein